MSLVVYQLIIALLMLLVIAMGVFIFRLHRGNKLIRNGGDLERLLQNNDMREVDFQLNPHLFKNILNTIQSHAYQTYYALDKLAGVLDYILYESRAGFVSAKREIDFALNLIDINKIKLSPLFPFSLKVKIDEEDPLWNEALVAPMISIDLIENAFKHADLQSESSFISVIIEFLSGVLSVHVSNRISEKDPIVKTKGGVGSPAALMRLEEIYGQHYTLQKFKEDNIFVAKLTINLHEFQRSMRTN